MFPRSLWDTQLIIPLPHETQSTQEVTSHPHQPHSSSQLFVAKANLWSASQGFRRIKNSSTLTVHCAEFLWEADGYSADQNRQVPWPRSHGPRPYALPWASWIHSTAWHCISTKSTVHVASARTPTGSWNTIFHLIGIWGMKFLSVCTFALSDKEMSSFKREAQRLQAWRPPTATRRAGWLPCYRGEKEIILWIKVRQN